MWSFVLTLVVLCTLALGLAYLINRRGSTGASRLDDLPGTIPNPARTRREGRHGMDPSMLRFKDRRDGA